MKMQAPEGASTYTANGKENEVPDDGIIETDAATGELLKSHGYTVVVERPQQIAAKKDR